jgi:photosystem II stability/assembly factor-like uncharacterized protein
MNKLTIFLLLGYLSLSASCKKDVLHFQSVQKLDSHTTTDRFNRIFFVNDTLGFIVGGEQTSRAVILTTHDGGYTWAGNSYPDAGTGIYGITQSPSGILYTIGYAGKMLYSKDTGRSWKFNQLYDWQLLDIAFANANYGIIVGGVSFKSGYKIFIDAAGNTTDQYYFSVQYNRIKMIDSQTGYILGYGLIEKTVDGGKTWWTLNAQGDDFTSFDFHNNGNDIWVCGSNGTILHSTDAGLNWTTKRNGRDLNIVSYHLYDIAFKDALHGWAIGDYGKIIYTDDGGDHWMEYNSFTTDPLRCMKLLSNGDLLVAGDNGSLYRLQIK